MKTTLFVIFLFIHSVLISQTTDVLYVPNQKSLVGSYANRNGFGLYFGGRIFTTMPQPFIYTTPMVRPNRIGLNLSTNEFSVMAGTYFEFFQDDESDFYPDLWLKVYPVRLLSNENSKFDLSLGLNYSYGFNYGVGLSISLGSIY